MKLFEKYPIIMMIAGVLGASSSAVLVRFSLAPSSVTAAYRLVFSVLLMTPAVLGKKETRQEMMQLPVKTVLLSGVSGVVLAIHFWTWFESLCRTTIASAGILVATEVIWVALGYCLFLHGRLEKKAIFAIMVAFSGSILIAMSDSAGGKGDLIGDILAVVAAIGVATYTLLGRVVRGNTSTTVYTYIVYFFCSLTLLLIVFLQGNPLFGYGWQSLLSGLMLAVFCTLMGHSIFSWCLKYFSPTFVSAAKLCEPVISTTMAIFFFSEIPGVLQVLGGIVVISGVVYYSVLEMRRESREKEQIK